MQKYANYRSQRDELRCAIYSSRLKSLFRFCCCCCCGCPCGYRCYYENRLNHLKSLSNLSARDSAAGSEPRPRQCRSNICTENRCSQSTKVTLWEAPREAAVWSRKCVRERGTLVCLPLLHNFCTLDCHLKWVKRCNCCNADKLATLTVVAGTNNECGVRVGVPGTAVLQVPDSVWFAPCAHRQVMSKQ